MIHFYSSICLMIWYNDTLFKNKTNPLLVEYEWNAWKSFFIHLIWICCPLCIDMKHNKFQEYFLSLFTFPDCISILSQKRSQKRMIFPKNNFFFSQIHFGEISGILKTLVFPDVFAILYFSQKHHTEKSLCHLAHPVSVFFANLISVPQLL